MPNESLPARTPSSDLTGALSRDSGRLAQRGVDRRRLFYILLGIGLFLLAYLSPG